MKCVKKIINEKKVMISTLKQHELPNVNYAFYATVKD